MKLYKLEFIDCKHLPLHVFACQRVGCFFTPGKKCCLGNIHLSSFVLLTLRIELTKVATKSNSPI